MDQKPWQPSMEAPTDGRVDNALNTLAEVVRELPDGSDQRRAEDLLKQVALLIVKARAHRKD